MRAVVAQAPISYVELHTDGTGMSYEVIEDDDEWIVRGEGRELGRFGDQDTALSDVAERLKSADASLRARLSVRYQARKA